MTYTEDFWSIDSDSAEEAARRLWEDENGPSAWGDLREADFDDGEYYSYRPVISDTWDTA